MLLDELWWWFSFFDKQKQPKTQLVGAALVQAPDVEIAKMALERFGIYSRGGGVCALIPAELGTPPEAYRERLLSPDEARTLADLMEARRPKPKAANLNSSSSHLNLGTGKSAEI